MSAGAEGGLRGVPLFEPASSEAELAHSNGKIPDMAAQSAAEFVERLSSDDEFAAQVKETLDDIEPKERHEAVKELGYEFSDEELKEALEEAGATRKEGEELSEDELEAVTGGTTSLSTTTYTYGDMDFGFPDETWDSGGTMAHATYW